MFLSFVVSLVILFFVYFLGERVSNRGALDIGAVQSAHIEPTTRLGGLAIYGSILICGFVFFPKFGDEILIVLAAIPLFIVGILEDLTGNVGARYRLLAAAISSIIAIYLTETVIVSIDIVVLDSLFLIYPIGFAFTVLATSGVANSFNLIDGVNGLSGGVAFFLVCLLGYACNQYGEFHLAKLCFIIGCAIMPFLIFNFPFGLVFLGDAGAYVLGFLICWISIILLVRHPEISAWAILLMFYWPVSDTILSIYRRFRSKSPSSLADNRHYHQLIMQLIIFKSIKDGYLAKWANPLSTTILLPFAIAPMLASLFFLESNIICIVLYFVFILVFFIGYLWIIEKLKKIAFKAGDVKLAEDLKYVFKPFNK